MLYLPLILLLKLSHLLQIKIVKMLYTFVCVSYVVNLFCVWVTLFCKVKFGRPYLVVSFSTVTFSVVVNVYNCDVF